MTVTRKKGLSDSAFDAITAVVLITVAVCAAVYWLQGMPS